MYQVLSLNRFRNWSSDLSKYKQQTVFSSAEAEPLAAKGLPMVQREGGLARILNRSCENQLRFVFSLLLVDVSLLQDDISLLQVNIPLLQVNIPLLRVDIPLLRVNIPLLRVDILL